MPGSSMAPFKTNLDGHMAGWTAVNSLSFSSQTTALWSREVGH